MKAIVTIVIKDVRKTYKDSDKKFILDDLMGGISCMVEGLGVDDEDIRIQLVDNAENPSSNESSVLDKDCPLCDGKGVREFKNCKPPIKEDCPGCYGKGKLKVAAEIPRRIDSKPLTRMAVKLSEFFDNAENSSSNESSVLDDEATDFSPITNRKEGENL